MLKLGAAVVIALVATGASVSVHAQGDLFEARLAFEMEYFGQSYYNEAIIDLPVSDLPTGRIVETTRFADALWLPGQRVDLRFHRPGAKAFEARTTTGWNARRFVQEFDARMTWSAPSGSRWMVRGLGVVREEKDAFLGHGDWNAGMEARHDRLVGDVLRARVEGRVRHSRTRGDTTSFVYDYTRVEARASLGGGGTYRNRWEAYVRGVRKTVPGPLAGDYDEIAGGAYFRGDGPRYLDASVELARRDYPVDGDVGRDLFDIDGRLRTDLWRGDQERIRVEADTRLADYRGSDDLYYDVAEVTLHVPYERTPGVWTWSAGPRVRTLRDLSGGGRHYGQWGMRGETGRSVGSTGFAQVNLDLGYRDYASGAETVEVTSLSASYLRSDFWLMDLMLLADIPLVAGFSLDVLLDTVLEVHTGESERIHLTFATVSVVRTF